MPPAGTPGGLGEVLTTPVTAIYHPETSIFTRIQENTTLDPVHTTSLGIKALTFTIAILPLVFLISVILAIYISLKCHNQTNTFGIGPSIVITRTQNKKNNREMETSSGIGTGYYGTADGISCATSNCSLNDLKSEKM